jgi:predicted GIY-YIG superfamily endonuclease
MPAKKKKRKYTFRKGQIVPYESGSLMHEAVKAERELKKGLGRALGTPKKKRKRK